MLVEMRKCLIRTFCQMEMRSVPVGKRRYRLRGIEGHHRPVSARYDKSRYGTNPQLRRLMPNGELCGWHRKKDQGRSHCSLRRTVFLLVLHWLVLLLLVAGFVLGVSSLLRCLRRYSSVTSTAAV